MIKLLKYRRFVVFILLFLFIIDVGFSKEIFIVVSDQIKITDKLDVEVQKSLNVTGKEITIPLSKPYIFKINLSENITNEQLLYVLGSLVEYQTTLLNNITEQNSELKKQNIKLQNQLDESFFKGVIVTAVFFFLGLVGAYYLYIEGKKKKR